jgi:hypothetical protein
MCVLERCEGRMFQGGVAANPSLTVAATVTVPRPGWSHEHGHAGVRRGSWVC